MAIQAGETTFYQAKRGIVQDGLVLNLDAAVDASYSGGTTWRDLAGSNDGAMQNMNDTNLIKDNGGVFSFDGSNEFFNLTRNSQISPTSAITQECWFNVDVNNVSQVYIGCQYGGSYLNTYALWNTSTAWNGLIRNQTDQYTISYAGVPQVNTWYHFLHTYDGSSQKLYINAVNVATSSLTGDIKYNSSNTSVALGADYNSGYNSGAAAFVNGMIPIIRIYNRALTATEVLQNYNATRHRFGV